MARVEGRMTVARQMYDLMEPGQRQGFCGEHEQTIGETEVVCRFNYSGPLRELGDGMNTPGSALFVRRDADQVEVSFNLDKLKEAGGLEETRPDSIPPGMVDVVRASFAGHSVAYRISAPEIIETNGDVSEDASEARLIIPIVDILDKRPLPDRFYAIATGVQ